MGQNKEIKFALLATGFLGAIAMGSTGSACEGSVQVKSLKALESLTPIERVQARDRIDTFLEQYPDFDFKNHHFAVDKNGDIYVLDKNKNPLNPHDVVAQPSCIQGESVNRD